MVILILIGIVPCIITTSVVVRSYRSRAVSLRESSVKNQCEILCDFLESENYLSNPDSAVVNSELSLLSNVYNGRILIVDSDYRVVKDTYDIDTGKTSVSKEVVSTFVSGKGTSQYDAQNAYILMTFPICRPDDSVEGVLLVSVSTNEIVQNSRILENQGLLTTVIASLVVLILGYFLAGMLVKPFLRVTHAIEDVTDGFEDEAISVPDYTETVLITNAFNQMLSRVRTMDNSRQEFVSNVSHELKTPLTSMKVLADSLNGQDNVPNELYKEFMNDISKEIDREAKIIDDLLNLVKMDRSGVVLNRTSVDMNAMLEQILKRLRPQAKLRNIEMTLETVRDVKADVDEVKFSLAITNLVENAIKYNVDGGWVHVSLDADHQFCYIKVEDNGIGIPEDQQDNVFERFYRVDKARSRETGGTGLGLAITRNIILLHQGIIRLTSKEGEGSSFLVRIPLVYIEKGSAADLTAAETTE